MFMQKLMAALAILFGACSVSWVTSVSADSTGSEYRPQSSQNTPGGQAGNPSYTRKTSASSDTASARSDKENKEKEATAVGKPKRRHMTGWVKKEGGKTIFVNDRNKQSWDIENPDAVKGHDGHHIKLTATVDEANHSVTIDKVSMTSTRKRSAAKGKAGKD
jgi:hypothetical protein